MKSSRGPRVLMRQEVAEAVWKGRHQHQEVSKLSQLFSSKPSTKKMRESVPGTLGKTSQSLPPKKKDLEVTADHLRMA
jgi:hypothetical protein